MAITAASVLTKVKLRFNIDSSITTLDTIINGCIDEAVDVLNQYVQATTTDSSTYIVTTTTTQLSAPLLNLGILSIYLTADGLQRKVEKYHWQGGVLYFDEYLPAAGTLTVVYRTAIVNTAGSINLSIPGWYACFYNFCYAEFAAFLAGNASAYNVYVQASGARAVDNLLNLSGFYETKAIQQAGNLESGLGVDA